MKAFVAGVLAVIVVIAICGFVVVKFGLVPATADVPPSKMETRMAKMSLNATIAREQPQPPYPFGPATDATIVAGAKLYMQNCAECHGAGTRDETNAAKGMYITPPQLNKHGVDDDPEGETYWKIEHGIRFSGMPSYKGTLSEEQIWQITYFLKRETAKLPPAAAAIWNAPATAN